MRDVIAQRMGDMDRATGPFHVCRTVGRLSPYVTLPAQPLAEGEPGSTICTVASKV